MTPVTKVKYEEGVSTLTNEVELIFRFTVPNPSGIQTVTELEAVAASRAFVERLLASFVSLPEATTVGFLTALRKVVSWGASAPVPTATRLVRGIFFFARANDRSSDVKAVSSKYLSDTLARISGSDPVLS